MKNAINWPRVIYSVKFSKGQIQLISCSNKNIVIS